MGNPNFTKVNGLSELKDPPVEPGVKGQEDPYLDREGLREKIANSPVPEGIPDIHTPESKERQVINIPKNSRLAFNLAFYYRQNPGEYNDSQRGVVDLQSYLGLILQAIEENDEQVKNSLPEDCRSKEDCLKQMSAEEMTALVNEWKEAPEPNEGFYKQCDEYLEYLLGEQDDISEKKEEAEQAPESEFKAELVSIDESRLPYTLRAAIEVLNKPEKHFFIHLPPAVRAATVEEKQKYVEAFRQVLVGTKGKFFPRFDAEGDKLVVSMGPSSKRSTWQTVTEYSAEELAELTGKSEKETKRYIALRGENWVKLSEQEKKERDNFEEMVKELNVKNFVSAKDVNFKQAMRNSMVAERWITSIGEERYAELEEQAKNMATEKGKNRWGANDELLSSPEFQVKAKDFLNILKQRFDSWEKVLGPKSILSELSNLAKIRGAEALYVLGKAVLTGAREEFLAEFEKLYNLSSDDLKEYLKDHPLVEAPENETLTKAKILKYTLLGYVRARPIAGDVWSAKKFAGTKPETTNPAPETSETVSRSDRKSTLFDSLTSEEVWEIGKFLDQKS